LVRARALYARGQMDEARQITEISLPVARNSGILEFTWMGFEVIAPTALRGESSFSIAQLRDIAAVYPKRLAVLLDLLLITLHANDGRVKDATELAIRLGIWSPSGPFRMPDDSVLETERFAARMAGVALLTAGGHFKQAEQMIEEELARCHQCARRGAEVSLHLAQTAIHHKSGQQRAMTRTFSRAIAVAAEGHLLQPFYEQASLVASVLEKVQFKDLSLTTVTATSFARDVSNLVGTVPHKSEVLTPQEVYETLTPREVKLLLMLDAGMDNAEIASSLSISIPTVKWHLRNLYAKLEVRNRTSALARARSLKVL
jgi:LuxR family transcriptional regulator, maltose regulon positive regulatory protein